MSYPIFEQQSGEVSHTAVAMVYNGTNQLATRLIGSYMSELDSLYSDLDTFIQNADDDVESIFDALDQQFCEFLRGQHIYQYDEDDIADYTRGEDSVWQRFITIVVEERDAIDGKEASERAYRSARKDGRGRVVGGGFGFSGAVKGMAAAGAINMTTGLFHGIANAVGNAASAAEAARNKRSLFRDGEMRQALQKSLWVDCENMLAGFVRLWNRLGIGQMPWYSSDDLRQAENIQRAVQQGKVPSNQLEQALTQMLRTYPLDLSLYVTAADFLSEREADIFSAAAEYGIDMYARKQRFEETALTCARNLAESDVFSQYHEHIGYNFQETIEYIAWLYRSKFNSNFAVLSSENLSSYDSQLRSAHNSFAECSPGEEPVCFMLSGNKCGILLTDSHIYLRGTYPQAKQKEMDYGCFQQIELIRLDGGSYIQINNDTAVKVPDGTEGWIVTDVVKFFASYFGFMTYARLKQGETPTDAVLRYTGITEAQLESGIEFAPIEDSGFLMPAGSSEKVYCFNCGAENDAGSKFCMECGTEL